MHYLALHEKTEGQKYRCYIPYLYSPLPIELIKGRNLVGEKSHTPSLRAPLPNLQNSPMGLHTSKMKSKPRIVPGLALFSIHSPPSLLINEQRHSFLGKDRHTFSSYI